MVFTQDIPAGASGTNASNPILPEGHELEEGGLGQICSNRTLPPLGKPQGGQLRVLVD